MNTSNALTENQGMIPKPVSDQNIRVLGLFEAKMTIKDGHLSGKLGEYYNAIGRRYHLVGVESVRLSAYQKYVNLIRYFRRNREEWRAITSINPKAFRLRTALAEQKLRAWDGQYDLIMQLHTLTSAGDLEKQRPYVITTDNTYMNSLNYWEEWVPAPNQRFRDEWLQLETQTYQNAKYLFTWSEFTRQSFINDYHIDPAKVIAIGAGANMTVGDLTNKRYDTQTAVFVGYEFERKGGFYILEAWKSVRLALPNAKLYIIGPDKPLASPMPGVHWLGRIKDRQTLRQRLTESTVFVMPSLFEPWGHAFTEAMGMGLACIVADHCAMPEIVKDQKTGILVPPRTIEPLADAMIQLLGNPDLAQQMGHAAHRDIVDSNTWDDVIGRMAPYVAKAVGAQS